MGRAKKVERRRQRQHGARKLANGWRLEGLHGSAQRLGPHMTSASPEEVFAAIEKLAPDLPWEALADRIVPLFERVRPYPPGMPKLAQAIVPPGVAIGFGVDLGPAFMTVTPEHIERWAVSVGDVAARAIANLHSRAAAVRPEDVIPGALADVETNWLQAQGGIGSVLALAPTELGRIFGTSDRLFIAPMRDLLIGLPADVDRELAAWLFVEIASEDPNCLYPRAFLFDGRQVTVEPLLSPELAA